MPNSLSSFEEYALNTQILTPILDFLSLIRSFLVSEGSGVVKMDVLKVFQNLLYVINHAHKNRLG